MRKKTSVLKSLGKPAVKKRWQRPAWFPGSASLSSKEQACVTRCAASFRKAAAMDFYITKYQGKPMESLIPLFQAMTDGVHRLEKQEEQEGAEAESNRSAIVEETGFEAARKKQKTMEHIARRARRLTI